MQSSAWDFLTKPISTGLLMQKIERIKEISFLRQEHAYREKVDKYDLDFPGELGQSPAMKPVYEGILRAAKSPLPVLIEGDTGTGKEYIAKAVHLNSTRKNKPFVVIDCTATPESLFESVLFGSAKGAFTGATERLGLLDEANGGTLFMDEIGELTQEIQPKLLRCLETKMYRPVGKTKESTSDFRIVCATNRNLQHMVKESTFRSDLFYRVSAQKIQLPSLNERTSDISVLTHYFIKSLCETSSTPHVTISPIAVELLQKHNWPGNIRQLKFVIEFAFFNRQSDIITESDLNLEGMPRTETETVASTVDINFEYDFKTFREQAVLDAERLYMEKLMEHTTGDVRQAADVAGMTREALYRVMSRCGVSPKNFRESA
jgi:DNA-binding NtrC family response regulator